MTKKTGLPKGTAKGLNKYQQALLAKKLEAHVAGELKKSADTLAAADKEIQRLRGEMIKLQEELRQRAADRIFAEQGLRQRIDALNYALVLAQDQVKSGQTKIRRGLKSENFYSAEAPTAEQTRWDRAVGRDALALAG